MTNILFYKYFLSTDDECAVFCLFNTTSVEVVDGILVEFTEATIFFEFED